MSAPDDNPSEPLVDFDQLHAATDGDTQAMRQLLDLYFQQAAEIMAGLQKAVSEASTQDVNHLAHKLAGSSLACGISAVVPPVRQMEINARNGKLDGAAEAIVLASQRLELVRQRVEVYMRELPK